MYPVGWHVQEAAWQEEPVEGWVPVIPRGFVQLSDLAPAPTEDEPALLTPPPSSSRGSPLSSSNTSSPQADKLDPPSASGARAALLALREEHVRLREANLQLRERELKKKQEIDSLCRARELTAKELAAIQDELVATKQELESGREEQQLLLKKLEICREAVATAVKSIDAVYEEVPDPDTDNQKDLSGDEAGPIVARARQVRSQQAKQKAASAMEADQVISELLGLVGKPAGEAEDVAEEKYRTSQENVESIVHSEKLLETKVRNSLTLPSGDTRAPLRDLNRSR